CLAWHQRKADAAVAARSAVQDRPLATIAAGFENQRTKSVCRDRAAKLVSVRNSIQTRSTTCQQLLDACTPLMKRRKQDAWPTKFAISPRPNSAARRSASLSRKCPA